MSVGLAASLLAAGVLGDTYGRRRVYTAGLGAIGAGRPALRAAQEPWLFLAGRLVEGVGGASGPGVRAGGAGARAPAGPRPPARDLGVGGERRARDHRGRRPGGRLEVGSGLREASVVTGVAALVLLVPAGPGSGSRRPPRPGGSTGSAWSCSDHGDHHRLGAHPGPRRDRGTTVALVVVTAGRFGGVGGRRESRGGPPSWTPAPLAAPGFRVATLGSFTLGLGIIGMSSFVPTIVQTGLGADLWTERCSSPGGRGRAS